MKPTRPYTIVPPAVEKDVYHEPTQTIVHGHEVTAQWHGDGGHVKVFVPETAPLAQTAHDLIMEKGAERDELMRLNEGQVAIPEQPQA